MADQDEQTGPLDDLLAQMPRIAEAVKAFPEAVQPQAFEMLMAEARGNTTVTKPKPAAKSTRRRGATTRVVKEDGERKITRRRKGGPSAVRSLDLTPKGKPSLKAFVAEKEPKTQHDQNTVSVYYLSETLGLAQVNLDQVFTCYKVMGWREPPNLANSLALTANRKLFLDTANLDDIKITPAGRNHVRLDLPPKKKA